MKRNQNQAGRNASRRRPALQSKIQKGGGNIPPAPIAPNIALFLEADGGFSKEAVDLSLAEYAALKRASARSGDGILMFMANAALEKCSIVGRAEHGEPWPGLNPASKVKAERIWLKMMHHVRQIQKASALIGALRTDSTAIIRKCSLDSHYQACTQGQGRAAA